MRVRLSRHKFSTPGSPDPRAEAQAIPQSHPCPGRGKPTWRGRIHQWAFFLSIPAGAVLIAFASRAEARVSAVIFAVSLTALYGTSALYHRRPWSERASRKMKHLDHSMIFVLIAGSYTPITLLALRPAWGITLLTLAWTGAVIGVTITLFRLDQLRRMGMVMYLALGWLLVVALPQILSVLTGPELLLLAAGGFFYTVGAVVLATNWPNPSPRVFGYHEIWHAMVVAAGACHFAMIALLVH